MDTNMTFRIDSGVKTRMSEICNELGMTTSTAFNIFANAFVRANGMPFQVVVQEPITMMSREELLSDAKELLEDFSEDYRRMAE